MCNYCSCDEIDKCSIRGFMPKGFCCDKCNIMLSELCARKDGEEEILYEISDPQIITKIFDQLEEKIKIDLNNYKELILSKTKKEMIIR
ncbi:MAG: hypothetical protein ACTSPY_01695 [Candidatus Helarchaeota archaeon]